jgi:hypothetical protein
MKQQRREKKCLRKQKYVCRKYVGEKSRTVSRERNKKVLEKRKNI